MPQAEIEHPLEPFGFRRTPHWVWRLSPRLFAFCGAIRDIRLIVTRRLTLHQAWQAGYDDHSRQEAARTFIPPAVWPHQVPQVPSRTEGGCGVATMQIPVPGPEH